MEHLSKAEQLIAGAGVADVTPRGQVFLFGYPDVPRLSTGVHDPLLATALYLSDGQTRVILVAVDVIFLSLASTRRVRERIADRTAVPPEHILLSATHTHSGPVTVDCLFCQADPVVPKADPNYLQLLETGIVNAAAAACAAAEPARVGLSIADASGIGTNRRHPAGLADPQAPVLLLRRRRDDSPLAAMLVVSMHPTVLHEDSTLISGDLPAMTRQYLQANVLGTNCPVLWHTGAAGNLSPRHVVREHSFAEARRLGDLLGAAIARQVPSMQFLDSVAIECRRQLVDLPLRSLPSVQQAELQVQLAAQRLDQLRRQAAPPAQVRTAECDWFGARETLALARAAADGRIGAVAASCLPAEVQLIRIGPWNFVAWPGEIFVEFALEVKRRCPQTFIISYANGELQGYLVTQEAVDEGGYEASNALFKSPDSPNLLVQATLRLAGRHTGQKATP